MLKSYFKLAIRNFIRERFYSLLNVLGLSVGIAVVLAIVLYIMHETTYDKFHRHAWRIYRVAMHLDISGNATDLNATFPGLADALKEQVSFVEQSTRMHLTNGRIIKKGTKLFSEDKVLYADQGFLELFDFKLLAGDRKRALDAPNKILLTPLIASKYFDTTDWSDVVGQSIQLNQEVFDITGIIEAPPTNSHIDFAVIVSMESSPLVQRAQWDNLNVSTYVLLREGSGSEELKSGIYTVFRKQMPDFDKFPEQGVIMEPIVQKFTDIHLHSNLQAEFKPAGSFSTLYIFGSVAIAVLVLACVNFINLVTARSANRAKEVGVRKVLGTTRASLIKQFIAESVMLVLTATLVALGFMELVRTPLTNYTGMSLPFELLLTPQFLLVLIAFVLVLGVMSGSYPAFYLSSFKPAQVLKGKLRLGLRSGGLRNVLVGLQFTIAITLIICTVMVQRQLNFLRSKKLGFDKENVVIIDNVSRLASTSAFYNDLTQILQVESAGFASSRPVDDYDGMFINTVEDKDHRKLVNFSRVDEKFLDVLKYEFVAGRNFSDEFKSDSAAVVINERAANFLFGGNALGKKLTNDYDYEVIGVVKDFNFESLKNEVKPLVFFLSPAAQFLHVRIAPGNHQATLQALEKLWKSHTSELPFTYTFLDETYNNLYKQEVTLGVIFNLFTILGLLIACLGLVGLAAYMAEQRRKELSVRKVLGATTTAIIKLLSWDFIRIILVAFAVAAPLGYFLMSEWLDGFAFRTTIDAVSILSGGFVVVLVAMGVVSFQAIRAAMVNPVDSLKEE